MKYKLPLATNNHSWLDRIKLASFFLNPFNQWSMGKEVKKVEETLKHKSGYSYCVATSSGSTANTLVAMWLKQNAKKKKIVFPAITWSTSVSPFILAGFEPVFLDVNETTPLMSELELEKLLQKDQDIEAVFYTTLLGFRNGLGNLQKIKDVCNQYNVSLYVDSCEDTIGIFRDKCNNIIFRGAKAETTSFYLAHEFQGCPEMGAIFTNDLEQYEFYLMARNHGMIRGLGNNSKSKYENHKVDSKFDFAVLGNNFRPTEISAYALSLDLKRDFSFRKKIARQFYFGIYKIRNYCHDDMFVLPIVIGNHYYENAEYFIEKIKEFAEDLGIETRPIVSGNLLRQTCFSKYGNYLDYKNAEWFHNYGIYVGLYKKMNKRVLFKLRDKIAEL